MAPLQNPRHERFACGIVHGQSATRAFIAAGYSANNAYSNAGRLSRKEQVAARIAELKAQVTNAYVMSAREVLQRLGDIAEGGRDQLTVRALELLGKHHGLFAEGRVNVTTNFDRLSTAELLAIMAEGDGGATGAITDGRDRDGGKP
jgi:hypothetical protein